MLRLVKKLFNVLVSFLVMLLVMLLTNCYCCFIIPHRFYTVTLKIHLVLGHFTPWHESLTKTQLIV